MLRYILGFEVIIRLFGRLRFSKKERKVRLGFYESVVDSDFRCIGVKEYRG